MLCSALHSMLRVQKFLAVPVRPVTPSPEGKGPPPQIKNVWAFADALPGPRRRRRIAASQGPMAGVRCPPPIAGQQTPTGLPEARSAREYPKSVINRNPGSSGTRETRAVSRATDSGGFGDLVIRTRCGPCQFYFVPFPTRSLVLFCLSFFSGKNFGNPESIGGAF